MSRELQERLLHDDVCQESKDEGIMAETTFLAGKALVRKIETETADPDTQLEQLIEWFGR